MSSAIDDMRGRAPARRWRLVGPARVADGLGLAAAPTFALMALLTGVLDGGSSDLLCSTSGASPLNGMAAMYVLMSLFHIAPWLKRMSSGVSDEMRTAAAAHGNHRPRDGDEDP